MRRSLFNLKYLIWKRRWTESTVVFFVWGGVDFVVVLFGSIKFAGGSWWRFRVGGFLFWDLFFLKLDVSWGREILVRVFFLGGNVTVVRFGFILSCVLFRIFIFNWLIRLFIVIIVFIMMVVYYLILWLGLF